MRNKTDRNHKDQADTSAANKTKALGKTAAKDAKNQPLTKDERAALTEHESIIEKGLPTIFAIGNALREIQNGKLYREKHDTFADYCIERWGFGRAYGYRAIQAAKVVNVLKEVSPTGDKILPTSEVHVRPLTTLPPGDWVDAWQRVVARAKDKEGPITVDIVAEVVDSMKGKAKRKAEDKEGPTPVPIDGCKILRLLEKLRGLLQKDGNAEAVKLVESIEECIDCDEEDANDVA
jgi:hypothetical protein